LAQVRRASLLAILIVAILLSGGLVYLSLGPGPVAPSPPVPEINATLSVNLSEGSISLSPNLLGVNLRADSTINGTQGAAVAATTVRFVRWPGGGLADRYDPFGANGTSTIFSDNGSSTTAPSTPADFVSWCRSIACSAIVTVPGEIDSPSLGAQEVRFFETDLHFFPAYWEIGNEPGAWDHFSVPWLEWKPNQTAPPSPTQYSELVHRYVASMRSVDPSIRIIGLPGIGPSNSSEAEWVKETVAVNGANLSAVALHIYPAGPTSGNTTLAQFFDSLYGPNGIPDRIATARTAVAEACENCSIEVIADEVAAATGSNVPGFISGFPLVPYEATEAIQGIELNVSSLVFWVADSGYSGSWVTPDGSARAIHTLFTNLLASLPSGRLASNLTYAGAGLSATALAPAGSSKEITLLIANTNTSVAFGVRAPGLLPSDAAVSEWSWDENQASPVRNQFTGPDLTSIYVPPMSVARVVINASPVSPEAFGGAEGSGSERAAAPLSFAHLAPTPSRADSVGSVLAARPARECSGGSGVARRGRHSAVSVRTILSLPSPRTPVPSHSVTGVGATCRAGNAVRIDVYIYGWCRG
jgi:hypothetical protein